jgi:hypothetical protein
MFISQKELPCYGLRYPKIFTFKNVNYLIGSKKYEQKEDIVKYGLYLLKLDEEFNIIDEGRFIEFEYYPYLDDILLSGWTRDIFIKDNSLHFIFEIKENVNNDHFQHHNYLVSTSDLIEFSVIKKYHINDFLYKELSFNKSNYLITAKIEKDIENPTFNWGIYLINIIKDNKSILPTFDKIVNYKEDKGHVIGNIEYDPILDKYTMYFSIRHKVDTSVHICGFIYKVYKAETNDLINYSNTQEVKFNNTHSLSDWYSYPHYFKYKDHEYMVCNQDDFGKTSNPILFKKSNTLV